jgi:hypothetical protein
MAPACFTSLVVGLLHVLLYSSLVSCQHRDLKKAQQNEAPVSWLHAPKTASSFCMTIQHVFDKDEFETREALNDSATTHQGCISLGNYYVMRQWHQPWTDAKDNLYYVGNFRDPRSRIISAFFDSMHHEGVPEKKFQGSNISKAVNITQRFKLYINAFDMRGCQVL